MCCKVAKWGVGKYSACVGECWFNVLLEWDSAFNYNPRRGECWLILSLAGRVLVGIMYYLAWVSLLPERVLVLSLLGEC